MSGDPRSRFTIEALGRFLIAPDAGERLSPVGAAPSDRGPGIVVVDLTRSGDDEARDWGRALEEALPILPCVTIAIADDALGESRRALLRSFDVVIDSDAALESLLAGFAETPIAALAFVQLLRAAPRRTIHEGLIAESFVYSTLQAGAEFRTWLESRRRTKKRSRPSAGANDPACRLTRHEDRLEICFTRAEKHNAFSRAMRDELSEALQLVLADASIASVTLSGEGDSFCSGGDLDEFGSFPDPAEAHAIRTTRSPALLLARLADRVHVSVHGACIGAGAELPAFTEHVVASEDAFFALPEVGLGLVPGAGGTVSLPGRIGRQRTAWLGLSGARIDARTALDWGLVDEVRLGQHVEGLAGPEAARKT